MKLLQLLLFTPAAVLLLGEAKQGGDDVTKKAIAADLQKLDGSWRLTALEIGGKMAAPETWGRPVLREFSGTKCNYVSGLRVAQSEITIDPAKAPKWMDERNVGGKPRHGIYELKADTLRLFLVPVEEKRPMQFKTKEGTQQAIATYERAKPAND